MAIYHLSVKAVSRATGRSAVAAAAYRSGSRLTSERDGLTHDYTRRRGVEAAFVVAPEGAGWALDRGALWNAAEAAERRRDAKVAREYELALPHELGPVERRELAEGFARELAARLGVAADVALHAPGGDGDRRNHHAHVLTTTRVATAEGLGAKTRALDVPSSSGPLVEELRAAWAGRVNAALERARETDRVDHRSLERQGLDLLPTRHLGPEATAMERRAARGQGTAPTLGRGEADGAAAGSVPVGSAAVPGPGPVTRIGRHNAAVAERNALLGAARHAWEAAREGLATLERAAADGVRRVMALARGLGGRIAAERTAAAEKARDHEREQERARQAEAARQAALEKLREGLRGRGPDREREEARRARERDRGLDLGR